MTGKSTLLDGLRSFCSLGLPQTAPLDSDVKDRSARFLSGNPTITLDLMSPIAATLPFSARWPARFFTQRELASIAKDAENVRKILYHLAPSGSEHLDSQETTIRNLDRRLLSLTQTIETAHAVLAEKEQAFASADKARLALNAFKEAGADKLGVAQADQGRVTSFFSSVEDAKQKLSAALALATELKVPKVESLDVSTTLEIKPALESIAQKLDEVEKDFLKLSDISGKLVRAADVHVSDLRASVQKSLVDHGRNADELNQFDALSKIATNYEACRIAYEAAKAALKKAEDEFSQAESERQSAVETHRAALETIIKDVNANISKVRISLSKAATRTKLDEWVRGLKEMGITRWWNENVRITDPSEVYTALISNNLTSIGMSATVASRFIESMSSSRKYQLRAMRSDDECRIEARVGPGDKDFRPINKLSGGKQISVLLTLLLESKDTSPLVIDQPEDELDKAFLADTLLPILRKLKGKRQIIFATHDANLVVNGDADQVIHLEADAENACVKTQDAIDNPEIRQAVLSVLDGGKDAFDLRKRKYGF